MLNSKKTHYRHFKFALVFCCFIQTTAAEEPAKASDSLTLGFLPYLTAGELMQKYTPLATYLGKEVGIPVTIKVTKDYVEHTQLAGEDKIDIAFLGGIVYVKVVEKYGKKRLLARYEMNGKPTFQGIIIVSKKSPLQNLSELTGKRVAFGDPNSTLSSIVPRYMLKKAGVTLDQLSGYEFLKNQQNVVFGVLFGEYAAGAVAQEVFDEYQARGLRALASSPDISTHVFIASKTLSADLVEKLQKALYNLKKQPNGKTILSAIGKDMTGFVPVKDSDYDLLRTILKETPPLPAK
jgi:phosphonate transport system substrate-binding protein